MRQLNIEGNRSARKYSSKEFYLRILWGGARWLFRWSPRPCFGFRNWLLRVFGARVGKQVHIYPSACIYFPWNLEIGDYSSIGEWTLVYNLGKISIGERSTVSHRVHLCAGTHDYRDPLLPLLKTPIFIGDEVWVCADAFIGPGVTIGTSAVVGAASSVFANVSSWNVVGGNPARFIKKREMI